MSPMWMTWQVRRDRMIEEKAQLMPPSLGSTRPCAWIQLLARLQRARGAAPHAERFRQGIVGVEKAANSKFGGFASALVTADAVRHGGNDVAVERAPLWPRQAAT